MRSQGRASRWQGSTRRRNHIGVSYRNRAKVMADLKLVHILGDTRQEAWTSKAHASAAASTVALCSGVDDP